MGDVAVRKWKEGAEALPPDHPSHLCFQEQQEAAQQERKRQQDLRLALKQEQRARAQQGHRPYFFKKCEWGAALPGWLQGQCEGQVGEWFGVSELS